MALRRGFKSEAKNIAKDIRAELNLSLVAPLSPWTLADHLAIPVIRLSSMQDVIPNAVNHFSLVNPSEFSAVTVFSGPRRIIVYNDSHIIGRQANDITHELSHGILLHIPKPALDANGCRIWDEDMEDEADWLSSVLLISEEAALSIVKQRLSIDQAATYYGVSQKLVRWRLGMTGAYKRLNRTRQYYKRLRSH
jgi:Zn-dependent peptidase ImmA (M78 family)